MSFVGDHAPPQKAAMFLKPARAEERLQLGLGPCPLPDQWTFRCPGHPPMGSPVERGYKGPPVPANLRSSGRDGNPAMTPKTLRHNTYMRGNILHIFCLNPRRWGLLGRLPPSSREGCAGRGPYNQELDRSRLFLYRDRIG
jgi:hypothetical protein